MSCVVGCLACRVPLGRILDGENRVEDGDLAAKRMRRRRETGWAHDDDRDAGGKGRVANRGEIPMDERVAGRHDVALLEQEGEALAVQAHRVDAQVDEDRDAACGGHNGRVRLELRDDAVDGGMHGDAVLGGGGHKCAAVTDNAAGEDWIGYFAQRYDVRGEGRSDRECHRLASISSTRSSESGPMTT